MSCCCPAPQVNLCTCDPEPDPAGCNSLSVTPDGLLVPRTLVQAMPPQAPNPLGPNRSVDIVVQHPGGCPDQWNIGARLSPVFGNTSQGQQNVGINAGWVNTPLVLTLPQPGRYWVSFSVTGRLSGIVNAGTSVNRWMQARAVNAGTGAGLIGARFLTQLRMSVDAAGTAVNFSNLGTASVTAVVVATAAMNVRAQIGSFGNGGASVQATRLASYGSFHKITD